MAKTWAQKLATGEPKVETTERAFAGMPAGAKMLVTSPLEVRGYVAAIPRGESRTIPQMRVDLAAQHGAEFTCPLTASIFARIVSEAAWDEHENGAPLEAITPFWRLVGPTDKVASKLRCGPVFLRNQRASEGTI